MGQTYPTPIGKTAVTPAYVPVTTFFQGTAAGAMATGPNEGSASTTDLTQYPRYHDEKAGIWSTGAAAGKAVDIVWDITKPLGPVGPKDAYPTAAPAAPTVASLSPNTGVHGAADVTMTVTGTNFTPNTQIIWNGKREHTVYISATQVSTLVKLSIASGAASIPVTVVDHAVIASPGQTFSIT